MLDAPQKDPLGTVITEARADGDLAALVGTRVRGFEPTGPSDGYEGDALGPGKYKAFLVISTLSAPPHRRLPITDAEFGVSAYGSTPQNAWAVWGAFVKAFHGRGNRVGTGGLGIYASSIVSGGQQDKDPDTSQPLVRGTLRLIATAQAVA